MKLKKSKNSTVYKCHNESTWFTFFNPNQKKSATVKKSTQRDKLLPPPSHPFRQHFEVQNPDQKTLKPMINQGLKDPVPGPFQ